MILILFWNPIVTFETVNHQNIKTKRDNNFRGRHDDDNDEMMVHSPKNEKRLLKNKQLNSLVQQVTSLTSVKKQNI